MDKASFIILRILLSLLFLSKIVYPLENLPLYENFGLEEEF